MSDVVMTLESFCRARETNPRSGVFIMKLKSIEPVWAARDKVTAGNEPLKTPTSNSRANRLLRTAKNISITYAAKRFSTRPVLITDRHCVTRRVVCGDCFRLICTDVCEHRCISSRVRAQRDEHSRR